MATALRLVSSDGQNFEIARDACQPSGLIQTILADEEGTEEIPVDKVEAKFLTKIVEYLTHI
jgi:S-phase kinase-associated protein 1